MVHAQLKRKGFFVRDLASGHVENSLFSYYLRIIQIHDSVVLKTGQKATFHRHKSFVSPSTTVNDLSIRSFPVKLEPNRGMRLAFSAAFSHKPNISRFVSPQWDPITEISQRITISRALPAYFASSPF